MRSQAELRTFFESDLRAELEALDQDRKRILKRTAIAGAVLLGLFGLSALFLYQSPIFLIPAAVVGVVLFFLIASWIGSGFRERFKQAIVTRVVEYLDPSLTYEANACIEQGHFEASRIFLKGIDRYRGEDCVTGTIDKTAVRFSEVHAEYKTTSTDSKGRTKTTWHTIFKGLFFVADFNKHFHGVTVVLPDAAEKTLGKWLGQTLQSMNLGRPDSLVKLEDPEFEREFAVYADDQVEARYVLSPALMRRLLEFRNRRGSDVYVSFAHSNVYVAMPMTKNMFEPRMWSSLVDVSMIEEFYSDLVLALGIVEELNLNTRIWTKQ